MCFRSLSSHIEKFWSIVLRPIDTKSTLVLTRFPKFSNRTSFWRKYRVVNIHAWFDEILNPNSTFSGAMRRVGGGRWSRSYYSCNRSSPPRNIFLIFDSAANFQEFFLGKMPQSVWGKMEPELKMKLLPFLLTPRYFSFFNRPGEDVQNLFNTINSTPFLTKRLMKNQLQSRRFTWLQGCMQAQLAGPMKSYALPECLPEKNLKRSDWPLSSHCRRALTLAEPNDQHWKRLVIGRQIKAGRSTSLEWKMIGR